ncbi:hypothetical protein JTE90_003621 [Oedothorax gibbosus]|uniref:BPTI/Kunitz inhibitor domain-containing protein n=1 Tax=Oedothorax gibbosus TaxID=931172 RepID=A0AAV6VEC9_9ARAC|nr:hypothetical protein JTE90_003621 [Oedothorax gibbosus]
MERISATMLFICMLFGCAFAASFPFNQAAEANASSGVSRCQQPPQSGLCLAYFPRFYFNATTGKCQNFVYGGCQGNQNNFFTEEECMKACGGDSEETPKKELESPTDNAVVEDSAAVSEAQTEEDVCSLPKEPGLCYALFTKYYFNGEKCETFTNKVRKVDAEDFIEDFKKREAVHRISISYSQQKL